MSLVLATEINNGEGAGRERVPREPAPDTQTLTDKLNRLEELIDRLEDELRQARALSAPNVLEELKQHGVLLTYAGEEQERLEDELIAAYGFRLSVDLMRQLFVLGNAPILETEREDFRRILRRGLYRW